MFMDALASIQFQDVTRQQLEHAVGALVRLDQHACLLGQRLLSFDKGAEEMRPLSEQLQEIYSGYVMQAQRDDHHKAVASVAPVVPTTRARPRDLASAAVAGAVGAALADEPQESPTPESSSADNGPRIELF